MINSGPALSYLLAGSPSISLAPMGRDHDFSIPDNKYKTEIGIQTDRIQSFAYLKCIVLLQEFSSGAL